MSTLTAGDAISEVRVLCGLSASDKSATDSDMLVIVNAAARRISTERSWPWLQDSSVITVPALTYEVSLPSDCLSVDQVALYSDPKTPLSRLPRLPVYHGSTVFGTPNSFYVNGRNLYVSPVSRDAIDLIVWYRSTEAVASLLTDTYKIEDWAWDLLVLRAAVIMSGRLKDSELRKLMRDDYTVTLSKVGESYNSRTEMRINSRRDTF